MQLHHLDIIDSVTEQVDFITGLLFKLFWNSCVLLIDVHFFCLVLNSGPRGPADFSCVFH